MSLVIVDDDPAIRALVEALAEMDGRTIIASFAGMLAACEWAGWADVTAAIIDWMMPVHNGGELLDWLAANHPHVTCVILTAHPEVSHPNAIAVVDKVNVEAALSLLPR